MRDQIDKYGAEQFIEKLKELEADIVFLALNTYETDETKQEKVFESLKENIPLFQKAGLSVGIWIWAFMLCGDKKYVLEINTRQGRSCDYLRAAGVNIAELLVRCAEGENIETDFSYKEIYWHYPPHKTVMRYSGGMGSERANRLYNEGKSRSPYNNGFEGIIRRTYVAIHNMRLSNAIKKSFTE